MTIRNAAMLCLSMVSLLACSPAMASPGRALMKGPERSSCGVQSKPICEAGEAGGDPCFPNFWIDPLDAMSCTVCGVKDRVCCQDTSCKGKHVCTGANMCAKGCNAAAEPCVGAHDCCAGLGCYNEVCEAPAAPTLTCDATLTITEGDAATASGAYSVSDPNTGDAPAVSCVDGSGNAVDDLSSLAAGSYTVTCTAVDGDGLSDDCTIALRVDPACSAATEPCVNAHDCCAGLGCYSEVCEAPAAPTLTCDATLTITEGDAATASGAYSVSDPNTGDAPTVSCVDGSGNAVDDLSSLAAGSYTVTCTAVDGDGLNDDCTIALTVDPACSDVRLAVDDADDDGFLPFFLESRACRGIQRFGGIFRLADEVAALQFCQDDAAQNNRVYDFAYFISVGAASGIGNLSWTFCVIAPEGCVPPTGPLAAPGAPYISIKCL